MQPSEQKQEQIRTAAEWFACHGRDGTRAIVPSIKTQFPRLSTLEAIRAAQMAAEISPSNKATTEDGKNDR